MTPGYPRNAPQLWFFRRTAFLLRYIATLALAACVGTGPLEPTDAYTAFMAHYHESTLAVAEAARYLSRQVLEVRTGLLPAGRTLSPSDLFREAHSYKDCGGTAALEGGLAEIAADVAGNESPSRLDPLPAISPPHPSRGPHDDIEAGLEASNPHSQSRDCEQCEDPRRALAAWLCRNEGARAASDPDVPEAVAARDLDYIIVVAPSCCSIVEVPYALHSETQDNRAWAAEKYENERDTVLRAATYKDSEILTLLYELPIKYRNRGDDELALPDLLRQVVLRNFEQSQSRLTASFRNWRAPQRTLTFSWNELTENPGPSAVGPFDAASDGQRVYVAPLLARAPFFMCYNGSVRKFLEERYRIANWFSRVRSIREITIADAVAAADALKAIDSRYSDCVGSQLSFIFAHEFGHFAQAQYERELSRSGLPKSVRNSDSDEAFAEFDADCFAFVSTQRKGAFTLGAFEPLFLDYPKAPAFPSKSLRRSALDRLMKYFEHADLPSTGESGVRFCDEWASRTVDITSNPT